MARPVRTWSYRNPRFFDRAAQTVIFNSPIRAYTHVVRDVQPFGENGRLHGWVRHQGGDWVVRECQGRDYEGLPAWEVIEAISVRELRS